MHEQPLAIGLLGYGISGGRFHAPVIESTPGVRLATVVTDDPAARERARARHPGATILASVEEIFADSHRPDVLVVATPNDTHLQFGLRAIEHGIPVVVDKPLAASADDAERLVTAARERSVFLTVFQNRRWDGDFIGVQQVVQDGRLGTIHRFESRFQTWSPEVKAGWRENPSPTMAAGLLVDLGAHLVDQAVQLFGEVDTVYAEVDRRRIGSRVDDDSLILLHHASGVRSHLLVSGIVSQPEARFHVVGGVGSYTKHGLDIQEAQLAAGLCPGDPSWGLDPVNGKATLSLDGRPCEVEVPRGCYESFYAGLVASLRNKTKPPVDPADAVYTLRILDAARRSAVDRKAVNLVRQ